MFKAKKTKRDLSSLALHLLIQKHLKFKVDAEGRQKRIGFLQVILLRNLDVIEEIFTHFALSLEDISRQGDTYPAVKVADHTKETLKVFLEEFCQNFWLGEYHPGATREEISEQDLKRIFSIPHGLGKMDILFDREYKIPKHGLQVLEKFVTLDRYCCFKKHFPKGAQRLSTQCDKDFSSIKYILEILFVRALEK